MLYLNFILINQIRSFYFFSFKNRPPSGSNQYGPYGNRPYSQPPPGGSQTPTPPGAPTAAGGPPQSGPPAPGSSPYPPPGGPGQQDYYRPPDQVSFNIDFIC